MMNQDILNILLFLLVSASPPLGNEEAWTTNHIFQSIDRYLPEKPAPFLESQQMPMLSFSEGGQSKNHGPTSIVGQGVFEKLQTHGEAEVIVKLRETPALKAARTDLPTLRSKIKVLQDQVLSKLESSEFRVRLRFHTVPAFAGTISPAGLEKLAANPNVIRIDLDVGGGGK